MAIPTAANPTAVGTRSGAARRFGAIYRAELKLLVRNTTAMVTAALMPLAIAVVMSLSDSSEGPLGWAVPVAMQLLVVFGMSAYITSAAALCYRRDDLYLKRLRCAEASDGTVLAGVLSPTVTIAVAQSMIMLLLAGIVGSAVPTNPVLLVLVIVGGIAMCVSLGIATSGFAANAEQAQTVTMPFFLLLVGSVAWALMDAVHGLNAVQLALPGGAVLELVRLSYDPAGTMSGQLAEALPALGVLAAWILLGVVAARRYFRWEPRS